MFCRNCGSNIPEGHTECIHCGTKVSKASLASLQSFNNTQVVQKKSSNTGYLVIIFFLTTFKKALNTVICLPPESIY